MIFNNKFFIGLAFMCAVATLPGCSSNQPKPTALALEACKFPGTQALAPGWVCDEPVPNWPVTAPGAAEKTAAGISFQKQMAAAAARVQLAQQVKVRVASMIKQFAETTGAGDMETVDRVNTSVTKQITDESLSGTRILRTVEAPDGRLWVLVGLDDAALTALTKSAVNTSLNNERAAWQKFQAGKAQDELANAIAAQK